MVRKVYPEQSRRTVARRSPARWPVSRSGPSPASWAPYEGRRGFLSGPRLPRAQQAAWAGAKANRAAVLAVLTEKPCARIDLVRATGLAREDHRSGKSR